jgi:caffeoyl-CoA O-methyltransferase
MSTTTEGLDARTRAYLLAHTAPEPEIATRLREETAAMPEGGMQISPEQGAFMALLMPLLGVRSALEVGTFTGYSALRTALALPEDGRLVCCDVSEAFTAVGRRYWREAGVESRIELRIAPATETLAAMIDAGETGQFDFAFIDADKSNYDAYYEDCLKLVRPGGLIAVDNVLWSGAVADPAKTDADTAALKALNDKLRDDDRITMAMLPLGDGLTLAMVR